MSKSSMPSGRGCARPRQAYKEAAPAHSPTRPPTGTYRRGGRVGEWAGAATTSKEKMMKALLSTATGGPEPLTLGELQRPNAGKGKIVIDAQAGEVYFQVELNIGRGQLREDGCEEEWN